MICTDPMYEGNFNWYSKRRGYSNRWIKDLKPSTIITATIISRTPNGTGFVEGDFIIPFEYLGRV